MKDQFCHSLPLWNKLKNRVKTWSLIPSGLQGAAHHCPWKASAADSLEETHCRENSQGHAFPLQQETQPAPILLPLLCRWWHNSKMEDGIWAFQQQGCRREWVWKTQNVNPFSPLAKSGRFYNRLWNGSSSQAVLTCIRSTPSQGLAAYASHLTPSISWATEISPHWQPLAEHLISVSGIASTLASLLSPLREDCNGKQRENYQFSHQTLQLSPFPSLSFTAPRQRPYLALDHSCENRSEVLQVSALQLRHDPRIQQHQAEPPEGWLHFHHKRVTQVHDGCLLPAAGADVGCALDQDVPRVQVSMDKVVNKDLEDGQVLEQLVPTKHAHTKTPT